MRCFIAFFFALSVSFFTFAENDSCSVVSFDNDDCPLKGRVKIVGKYEICDLVVRFVPYTRIYDFAIEVRSSVPSYDECPCGVVQFVGKYDICDIRVKEASETEICDLIVYIRK